MEVKYNIMLIRENLEGYKIVGVKEGRDIYDFISKKYDRVLDPDRGSIVISGDIYNISHYLVLDSEYDLNFDEKKKWSTEND